MAGMIRLFREASAPDRDPVHTLCRNSWRLFHLVQFIGMSGSEIHAFSVSDTDRLLATLNSLLSSAHGPVWQRAFERHYQREFLKTLERNTRQLVSPDHRPRAQVVFCIDEREESIRRHFESQEPTYETFGAAGCFGVVMNYSALIGHGVTPLCPVVVTPSNRVVEEPTDDQVDQWDRETFIGELEGIFLENKKNVITS